MYSYYDSEAKKIVKEPAAYYRNGERLTKEGRYEITVSDAAGNSSTCTVVIDRSPPTFTSTEFSKSAVYASYSASDAESPISATYTFATSGGTSAAKSYGSGITEEQIGILAAGCLSPNHATQFKAFIKQIKNRVYTPAK